MAILLHLGADLEAALNTYLSGKQIPNRSQWFRDLVTLTIGHSPSAAGNEAKHIPISTPPDAICLNRDCIYDTKPPSSCYFWPSEMLYRCDKCGWRIKRLNLNVPIPPEVLCPTPQS
jgi:hypothetical protein